MMMAPSPRQPLPYPGAYSKRAGALGPGVGEAMDIAGAPSVAHSSQGRIGLIYSFRTP